MSKNEPDIQNVTLRVEPELIKDKYKVALNAVNQASMMNDVTGYQEAIVIFQDKGPILASKDGIMFKIYWVESGYPMPEFVGSEESLIEVLTMSELCEKCDDENSVALLDEDGEPITQH